MGIGFAVIVPKSEAAGAIDWFQKQGTVAYQIGEVVAGSGELLGIPA
jgi:phosphoribosylformylglycinamidine cyclo-ligase